MKQHHDLQASKTAIYAWLRTARGERYCSYLYSKRKRVRHRKRPVGRTHIPHRVGIEQRPAAATNRTRYGHWEADTVVSKKGTQGGVKTVYERTSRLFMAKKVVSMRPHEHAQVERTMFTRVEAYSVTRDNGIENRDHAQVPVPSFFARPYHSWEKGGVENANKMLRRYFPKRTDFNHVSARALSHAVWLINNKPRKILGYRSALEVAVEKGVILDARVLTEG